MHDTTLTSLVRIALKAMQHGARHKSTHYRFITWRSTPYDAVFLTVGRAGLRMRFFDDFGGSYTFPAKSQIGGALCEVFLSCFS